MPTLTVVVERAEHLAADADAALAQRVRDALTAIRLGARVQVVPYNTLPRVDARSKARRVVDRRVSQV